MHTVALLLAAALPIAVPPPPAAGVSTRSGVERVDKGVRFELPPGYTVQEKLEREPNEPVDTVYIARQGAVEIRVEVESGRMDCSKGALAGEPRQGIAPTGRTTCELEAPAPPSLAPGAATRHGASVLVQYPGRFLSVVVFAPDRETAIGMARLVAASASETR